MTLSVGHLEMSLKREVRVLINLCLQLHCDLKLLTSDLKGKARLLVLDFLSKSS